ncbi:hypothetical protein SB759_32330, partial [Pseudomonas sp. SIMBA_059]
NPAGRIFDSVWDTLGTHDEFPYAATTYRLTEHFHFWSKHCRLNAIAQPEQFVEIGEVLANVAPRIDDDRLTASLIADQVGAMGQAAEVVLIHD